tara:strand:- start:3364 stop:3726 length:363 start_codon:yes stop_codon:yes gene_type:complete
MSEEVIGTVGEKNEYNLIGGSPNKYQCPNCRKNIHCIAGFKDVGDPVIMLKDRCGKDCECKCRHSYLAKNGKLRKYYTVDDTDVLEDFTQDRPRDATDDLIDEINAGFNADRKDRMVIKD